jgi:hypothetical protein
MFDGSSSGIESAYQRELIRETAEQQGNCFGCKTGENRSFSPSIVLRSIEILPEYQ